MSSDANLSEEIDLKCPFYKCCKLPKLDFLCNQFLEFRVCPEYKSKREKLIF